MAFSLLPCDGSSEFQGDTPVGITLVGPSVGCCWFHLLAVRGAEEKQGLES